MPTKGEMSGRAALRPGLTPRALAACVAVVASSAPLAAQTCATARLSVSSNGIEGGGLSSEPVLSADGRFAAFHSVAEGLVPGDTNLAWDVFVHDRHKQKTERVSVNSDGVQGNSYSVFPAVSADSRFVAFASGASNLVPGDTNTLADIFVHDRNTAQTSRASVGSGGQQANGASSSADLSADGRFAAFASAATNLVRGDVNGKIDVFVRDRVSATTFRVSVGAGGAAGNQGAEYPDVSADGRFVAFSSGASNLVPGDTNGTWDVFVHDREKSHTWRVSVGSGGVQGNSFSWYCDLSADGRFAAFTSGATNLVPGDANGELDVFVHDRHTGLTELASRTPAGASGNGASESPSLSADGRLVAFASRATDLVAGDVNGSWDAFVRDLAKGQTSLASLSSAGVQGGASSDTCRLSADGRSVAFASLASNLVPGDHNFTWDVFARTCDTSGPWTYCLAKPNSLGCIPSIAFSGVPSASASSGFSLGAVSVRNGQLGFLFYGTSGSALIPFQGGLLCVAYPIRRTASQGSGGSPRPASDCTGTFGFDFNSWIASGDDPALGAGEDVWVQYWSRDPGFAPPNDASLTDALTFVIQP